jgi:hypothetical protein
LTALESIRPSKDASGVFIAEIDEAPARYTIDGVEVTDDEWERRRSAAGLSAFVVLVDD